MSNSTITTPDDHSTEELFDIPGVVPASRLSVGWRVSPTHPACEPLAADHPSWRTVVSVERYVDGVRRMVEVVTDDDHTYHFDRELPVSAMVPCPEVVAA